MKNRWLNTVLSNKWTSLAIAMLFFVLAYITDNHVNFNLANDNTVDLRIKEIIQRKEHSLQRILFNERITNAKNILNEQVDKLKRLRERNLDLLIYDKDKKLLYWSSTDIDTTVIDSVKNDLQFIQTRNGFFLAAKRTIGDQYYIAFYKLYRQYGFENNYLRNGFSDDIGTDAKAAFSTTPKEGYRQINGNDEQPLFYYKIVDSRKTNKYNTLIFIFITVGAVFFLLHVKNHYDHLIVSDGFTVSTIVLFLYLLLLRVVFVDMAFPAQLHNSRLFSPEIYASFYFASLGDILITSFLIFFFIFNVFEKLVWTETYTFNVTRKRNIQVFHVITSVIFLFYIYFVVYCLRSLIIDSGIVFDFSDINRFTFYTYASLGIIIINSLSLWFATECYLVYTYQIQISRNLRIVSLVIAIAVLSIIHFTGGNTQVQFLLIAVILYFLLLLIIRIASTYSFLKRFLMCITALAIFTSTLFYKYNNEKENERVRLYSAKYSKFKDLEAEQLLADVGHHIQKDKYIMDYFGNSLILSSQLNKRINELYFTDYLRKYDIEVLDFDSTGNPTRKFHDISFDVVNQLLSQNVDYAVGDYFFFLTRPFKRYIYASKFEYCNEKGVLGYLFILLKPKLLQGPDQFERLLLTKKYSGDYERQYSHALYLADSLFVKNGSYPYGILNGMKLTDGVTEKTENKDGYRHYIKNENNDITIIVSRKNNPYLQPLSVFTILLTGFFLFLFVIFIINSYYYFVRSVLIRYTGSSARVYTYSHFFRKFLPSASLGGMYLSTRIQVTMMAMVLVLLTISGYFYIRYANFRYEETQREKILLRAQSVLTGLEAGTEFPISRMLPDEITGKLNKLAEIYDTDLSLFNREGTLMASSKNKIYESGIVNVKMDPEAYYHLDRLNQSLFTTNESIGELGFSSIYLPVFDSNDHLTAYLNIPNFNTEEELNENVSAFLVNFINLYLLFLLLSAAVSYVLSQRISSPLITIQEKLSRFRLGAKNERIVYHKQDEIGELVKQYNKLVEELEISVAMLAESERDSAWKEMARQIAHEIKNPLTPMKLSVQHLQQTWKERRENTDQVFERTMKLLLEQIDSLAQLANQFSGFAKLPTIAPEEIVLNDLLPSIASLFSHNEVHLKVAPMQDTIKVFADKDQLSRVFNNLILNAIQAGREDAHCEINIEARTKGGEVIISIRDNGTGVDEQIREKIFKPNFSTKTSGMGLGLAICKQMVAQMNGTMWFENNRGHGATFFVKLPLL